MRLTDLLKSEVSLVSQRMRYYDYHFDAKFIASRVISLLSKTTLKTEMQVNVSQNPTKTEVVLIHLNVKVNT